MIQAASQAHGVPVEEIRAIIGTESSFNPKARSKKGAGGLMQLMPRTAAELGVTDPDDPAQNIEAGTRYYKQQLEKYGGDKAKALAAYNWGPGNVDKFGDKYDKVMPKETRDYVRKITAQMGITKPSGKPGATTLAQDIGRGAAGVYRGLFQDLPNAGTQMVSALVPDKLERALSVEGKTGAETVADQEAMYQDKRVELGGEGIDLGRLAGNIVNPASLALGGTGGTAAAAGKAAAVFAKLSPKAQAVLGPMLRGGAAGAMMPVEGTDEFAIQKAKQVGIGAALGPVAEMAGRGIGKVAGRVMGARANDIQPGAAASQKLGDEFGVQLSAGDLAPQNKGLTGIESGLENLRLPFASMSRFRSGQQEQAKAAALKLVDDEYKALAKTQYLGESRLRALAGSNDMRAKEAQKIVQMIDDAGTDEKAIIQAAGQNRWLSTKLSADKAFNEVEVLAGANPVTPSNTLSAIDNAITKASQEVDVDPATIANLRKWKGQFENPTSASLDDPIEAAVNQMEGAAPGGEAVVNTYARMRKFRTDVNKRVDAATTNETTDSSKLFLKDIAAAVEKDMDEFAKKTPGVADANARANKWYREQVVPYQKQKLAQALTNEDPDKIYGAFIRSQAEGQDDYAAQRLFKALDNKGKQAVRYGIVKQAMANATKDGDFSPSAFRKSIQGTEFKTYFANPAERARVERLVDLFEHLTHADPAHLKKYAPMMGGMQGLGSWAWVQLLVP
jgi:hypothetical protein